MFWILKRKKSGKPLRVAFKGNVGNVGDDLSTLYKNSIQVYPKYPVLFSVMKRGIVPIYTE